MINSATTIVTMLMNQEAPTRSGFGLGLRENMLYDFVQKSGPGTATVNTHTMNVSPVRFQTENVASTGQASIDSNIFFPRTSGGRPLWASQTLEANTAYLWAYALSTSDPTTELSSSALCVPGGTDPGTSYSMSSSPLSVRPPACTEQTQTEKYPISARPCSLYSVVSGYLMDAISIQPLERDWSWWTSLIATQFDARDSVNISIANLKLHDLENALENHAAAFYWTLAHPNNVPTTQNIQAAAPQQVLNYCNFYVSIKLNGIPRFEFSRSRPVYFSPLHPQLPNILWLSGYRKPKSAVKNPSIRRSSRTERSFGTSSDNVVKRNAIAAVEEPSTSHLRKAVEKRLLRRNASWVKIPVGYNEKSITSTDEEETE
ncbi:hypothetical protein K438DRAFT_1784354 [Mycena galopus ATCC 62051]|nr:hypothetical protein K438DRAFT_1784354 [Mycena galopus ATCC 62051]